jgi:choloylglycine hydrolase
MKRLSIGILLIMLVAGIIIQQCFACTGIAVKTTDGKLIHGRTLEFGVPVDCGFAFIPRNIDFNGHLPDGSFGLKYKSKYATLGAVNYGNPAIMDGINEKGLSVGAFYFSGYANYSEPTNANKSKALSAVEFPNWILNQFATVEEVRSAVESNKAVIVPTTINGWGPQAPPLHYIVYDKTGKSIVIEPLNGALKVWDNPLGTITNSPDFGFMITNLRNYLHLSPDNVPSLTLDSTTLLPFGQGTGMLGLPGDYTPPSRFVRATFMSVFAPPSKNETEGVYQVFHILNSFDIPLGIVREKAQGQYFYDYTQATIVRDPYNLKVYVRMYSDQTIRMVDMTKFDYNSPKAMAISTMGYNQQVLDITSTLKPYNK